jgi:hypothetical protein
MCAKRRSKSWQKKSVKPRHDKNQSAAKKFLARINELRKIGNFDREKLRVMQKKLIRLEIRIAQKRIATLRRKGANILSETAGLTALKKRLDKLQ